MTENKTKQICGVMTVRNDGEWPMKVGDKVVEFEPGRYMSWWEFTVKSGARVYITAAEKSRQLLYVDN